ncbi:hypothetical protein CRE_16113 [Caenorhabditis remanei]|uniref:Uncharacterized protein n=1 Tax=Caenorhabditis remanei TaxID=31234 RepID=E3MBW7_CAERE|nr:hypothetical protein CRE_16113 [Caenorhabditis remanei]
MFGRDLFNLGRGGTSMSNIVEGGCTHRPTPFSIPSIFGVGDSEKQKIIDDLRRELRECKAELDEVQSKYKSVHLCWGDTRERAGKLDRELKEIKEIKESNDRIIASMKNKIENNQKNHDEQIAKIIEEHEENMSVLKDRNAECLKTATEDHEVKIEKLKKEQNQEIKELDKMLKKTIQESEVKEAKIEKENKILKSRQANELVIHQREMNRLVEEHQKETDAIRKEQEAMRNKLEEEKKKYHGLEHKLRSEFSTELTKALNRQITLDASNRVLKQFLNITKTVQDASEALKGIELYCSNESPEDFEGEIARDLHELNVLKANFKEHVFHFQQFVINEQNAHQEILNVCKSYLQKFEESMTNKSLLELCLHLPTAIENKKTFEIEEFKKKAEKLSEEMKITRDLVQMKLEAISADNQHEILSADMNSEIIIDDLKRELRDCKKELEEVKKTTKKEHEDKLTDFQMKIEELNEILKITIQESKAKQAKVEKENKILKSKQPLELDLLQKLYEEELNEELEQMKKYHALEEKLRTEKEAEFTKFVNRQNTLDASKRAFIQFLNITRTVQNASESLKSIERYYSNESPENFKRAIAVDLDVLKESNIIFRERVFHFQEFAIYERNVHQKILDVCEVSLFTSQIEQRPRFQSYLKMLEESMMNASLIKLCIHLKNAVEYKETVEIEESVKNAEKLSEEMKITRDEVEMKLKAILHEIQSTDMNSEMLPGKSD